jgi:hypothetical protein
MRQVYQLKGVTDPKVQEEKLLRSLQPGEVGFVHSHPEDVECTVKCHSVKKENKS